MSRKARTILILGALAVVAVIALAVVLPIAGIDPLGMLAVIRGK